MKGNTRSSGKEQTKKTVDVAKAKGKTKAAKEAEKEKIVMAPEPEEVAKEEQDKEEDLGVPLHIESERLNYSEQDSEEYESGNEDNQLDLYDQKHFTGFQENHVLEQILDQMQKMTSKIDELQDQVKTTKKDQKKTRKELQMMKSNTSVKEKLTPIRKNLRQILSSSEESSSESSVDNDDEDPEGTSLFMGEVLRNSSKKMSSPKSRNLNNQDYTYKQLSLGGYRKKQKMITIATEKHLELEWKDLSLDGFLCFLEEVEEFQIKHRMEVAELFPLIHRSMKELVAQQLMMNFTTVYIRRRDVQSATIEHITKAMQIYFTPNDINHFNALLKSSCFNYKVEQKTANFMTVKSALAGLRAKFMERYGFLKEACERKGRKKIIPHLNFKDGGDFTNLDGTNSGIH